MVAEREDNGQSPPHTDDIMINFRLHIKNKRGVSEKVAPLFYSGI